MSAGTRRSRRFAAWRDVDSERRQVGWRVWWLGCEAKLGRRVYRMRWWLS